MCNEGGVAEHLVAPFRIKCNCNCNVCVCVCIYIQGDSVTSGPKLLSIKNYVIEIMT